MPRTSQQRKKSGKVSVFNPAAKKELGCCRSSDFEPAEVFGGAATERWAAGIVS
jgi:hypothetical protein